MSSAPLRGYLPFFPAIDAARYFLFVAGESGDQLSHRQLQNLLYYGQGFSLVSVGKLLFGEQIEAGRDGPVVEVVAHQYSASGDRPIALADSFSPTGDTLVASTLLAERVVVPLYKNLSQVGCAELTRRIVSEQPFCRAATSDGIVEPSDLLRWWRERLDQERASRPQAKPTKLSEYLAQHPELASRLRQSGLGADESSQR
jgi:uncharacterized phage-associated protein